jgi:hypothetical protein
MAGRRRTATSGPLGTTIGSLFPFLPQTMADTNIGIIALLVNLVSSSP